MTDIVERLRDRGKTCGIDRCSVRDAASGCTCAIAADEIERLREVIHKYKHGYKGSCYACEPVGELNKAQSDEIERLRKALQYYAGHHAIPSEGPWGIDSDDFGNVARAALEG